MPPHTATASDGTGPVELGRLPESDRRSEHPGNDAGYKEQGPHDREHQGEYPQSDHAGRMDLAGILAMVPNPDARPDDAPQPFPVRKGDTISLPLLVGELDDRREEVLGEVFLQDARSVRIARCQPCQGDQLHGRAFCSCSADSGQPGRATGSRRASLTTPDGSCSRVTPFAASSVPRRSPACRQYPVLASS